MNPTKLKTLQESLRKQQQLEATAAQGQSIDHNWWLNHPITRKKFELLEEKLGQLIMVAQNLSRDPKNHQAALQTLSDSRIVSDIINQLREQENDKSK